MLLLLLLPHMPYGCVRLSRFARLRPLRHALPISLLILTKKTTVLQSTKRRNQRGTNVAILSEAFCAQTNLFWHEMKIL